MDDSSNVSIEDLRKYVAKAANRGNRVNPKQKFLERIDAEDKLAKAGEPNGYMYKQRAEDLFVVTPMNGARKMVIDGDERYEASDLAGVIVILGILRQLCENGKLDTIFAQQTAPSKAFRA